MIEAKFLRDGKWSEWEEVKLEWALNIAATFGSRSGDEFLFEDLPRFNPEYHTGGIEGGDSIKFKMSLCPCRTSEGWLQYKWKSLKWSLECWRWEIPLRARVKIREFCGIVKNV